MQNCCDYSMAGLVMSRACQLNFNIEERIRFARVLSRVNYFEMSVDLAELRVFRVRGKKTFQ
jgi:hypothetical protein